MRSALLALVACALLTGCSSVRDVRLTVRDASTNEPAPAVRVRAIALDTGTVPLPLDADTLDEMLAAGSGPATTTTTDNAGAARLRLRGRVAHLVELTAPPFGRGASDDPVSRFLLAERGGRITPVGRGAPAYAVEVAR